MEIKYIICLERNYSVRGEKNILIKENERKVGWYDMESAISFLKKEYLEENVKINALGFNRLEEEQIRKGLEEILKKNKGSLLKFPTVSKIR
jgi:hypothetical protein